MCLLLSGEALAKTGTRSSLLNLVELPRKGWCQQNLNRTNPSSPDYGLSMSHITTCPTLACALSAAGQPSLFFPACNLDTTVKYIHPILRPGRSEFCCSLHQCRSNQHQYRHCRQISSLVGGYDKSSLTRADIDALEHGLVGGDTFIQTPLLGVYSL